MRIEVIPVTSWNRPLNAARFTAHKEPLDREPTDKFKEAMCRSEHSPLRLLEYDIRLYDIPFTVVSHLTRHKHGVEFFVATSRPDRDGNAVPRHDQRKDDPTDMQLSINAQALINISRKRLCYKAELATRNVWRAVVDELAKVDPILAAHCVPDCVYKHHCTEPQPCGYYEKFKKDAES